MAIFKVGIVLAMVAVAQIMAQYYHEAPKYEYHAPKYEKPKYEYHHEEEEYAPPKYHFEYDVKDDHTYDIKSQKEERDGHAVKGYYTLVQPDGHRRIVEYTSDHKVGFNAIVHYEPVKGYEPSKYEAPKYEYHAPKYEAPKYEYHAPKYEAPKYEYHAPKYETPKYEIKYSAPSYTHKY